MENFCEVVEVFWQELANASKLLILNILRKRLNRTIPYFYQRAYFNTQSCLHAKPANIATAAIAKLAGVYNWYEVCIRLLEYALAGALGGVDLINENSCNKLSCKSLVGDKGLEPLTSSTSRMRSSQLS